MKFLTVMAACLLLTACQTTGPKPESITREQFDAPIQAGQTRLSIRNLNPEKWADRSADTATAARTVFNCKPLACAAPALVVYSRIKSPTRDPDREALSKLGNEHTNRLKADGWTIVSPSRVGTHRGYPSIHYVIRKEINGKMEYSHQLNVFAGGLTFSLISRSSESEVAKRNLDEFLSAIEIKDGGPRVAAR